jgi:O-antigen/teichoic acid export membrane protein
VRDAAVSSVTGIVLYLTGLISGPILARVLGPAGRGDIAAVLTPFLLLGWLVPLGLPSAAAYYVDTVDTKTGTRRSTGELLATVTVFGALVAAPVSVVLWYLAPAYLSGHSPVALTWARAVVVMLPLSAGVQAALEILRRLSPGVGWNRWRAAPILIQTIAIVVLAAFGRLTVSSALAASVGGSLTPLLLLLLCLSRAERRRPSMANLRLMLPYAWRSTLTTGASSLTLRLDQVLLVVFAPSAQLGLYAVAVMVASVTNPLNGLSLALFGHLRRETVSGRAESRFRRSLLATLVLSATVALGLAVVAPVVLRLVFGAAFEAAALPLRLLLPGAVAFNVLLLLNAKLYAEGRLGLTSRAAIVGALVTVGGFVLLVPRFGINGAAGVTSLAYLIQVGYLASRGALGWSSSSSSDERPSVLPGD